MDEQIIQSLADVDLYKLTMQQLAFLRHQHVQVAFKFMNRTKIRLPYYVSLEEVRDQIEAVRALRYTAAEIEFLRSGEHTVGLFGEEYLGFLATLQLPEVDIDEDPDGRLIIVTEDDWPVVTLWETIVMGIVLHLYMRTQFEAYGGIAAIHAEGERRLREKIELMRRHPCFRFIDFGTRRRLSSAWQRRVVEILANEIPDQFLGTSCVKHAMDVGVAPVGTLAHEMDMVYQGIYRGRDDAAGRLVSHELMLDDWWELYGERLSIALTDTYGSEYFWRTFGEERARKWKGTRQDSGDVFVWGEQAIRFYESFDIDPRTKVGTWSDGLDFPKAIGIHDVFGERLIPGFGIGTNTTNDCGPKPLSIVMKAVKASGHFLVKLSDNIAKAMGPIAEIERIKRLSSHDGGTFEECRY